MKKFACVFLSIFFLLSVFSVTAFALVEQDGLEVEIITDKEEYNQGEPIYVTVNAKNTNDSPVTSIKIEVATPNGYKLENGFQSAVSQEQLNAGETATLKTSYELIEAVADTTPGVLTPENGSNSSDVVQIPNTGEQKIPVFYLIIALLICAGLISSFAIIERKKSRKILSVILCLAIVGSAVPYIKVDATTNNQNTETKYINISKDILVNNEKITLKATVSYNKIKDLNTDSYTVSFDSDGGTSVTSQTVKTGEKAVKPANPTKDGWSFAGWYTETKGRGNIFDFTQGITKDMALHAFWIQNELMDENDDFSYETDEADISFDTETGWEYVNNTVMARIDRNLSPIEIQRILNSVNGILVGRFKNLLTIKVNKSSLSELENICNILEQQDGVRSTYCDMIIPDGLFEPLSYEINDVWNGDVGIWDEEHPDGSNWYLETIETYSAWQYKDYFEHINIGVFDGGLDITHEDLINKIYFDDTVGELTDKDKDGNDDSHGTMVCGIIGAIQNNNIGITGIVDDCSIYYSRHNGFSITKFSQIETTIKSFIEDKDVKVINFSVGGILDDNTAETIDLYVKGVQTASIFTTEVLCDLIEDGNEFLCVQAAGNGYQNKIEDGIISGMPAYGTFFNSPIMQENVLLTILNKHGISKDKFKSHIITVGAASSLLDDSGQNNSQYTDYKLANYSSFGENVDICAPSGSPEGKELYVLTNGSQYDFSDKAGTSAAAPMVTGVASLVWSINDEFTASDVKNILCNNYNKRAVGHHQSEGYVYPIVNARLSVEDALRKSQGFGSISGQVCEAETGNPLEAKIEIYSSGELYRTVVSSPETGDFSISLPAGTYELKVSKPSYDEYVITISLEESESYTLPEPIELEYAIWDGSIASSFAGGDGTENNPYLISNGEQLAYLSQQTALGNWNTRGKYYALTHDIYLNDISDFENWETTPPVNSWTPIGSRAVDYPFQFAGNFNGNNHTIYGAYAVDYEYALGLFGNVDGATISNLNIEKSYFVGNVDVGAFAGGSREDSLFYNCHSDCYIRSGNTAGGIVAWDDSGTFRYCSNAGTVISTKGGSGGIVGSSSGEAANYSTGTIEYCYNTGNVSGIAYVGGITGGASYISDCYNTGTVTAKNHYVGGIAGVLSAISQSTNYIQHCYNVGTVACKNSEGVREDRLRIGAIVGEQGFFTSVSNNYYLNTMDESTVSEDNWHFANVKNGLSDEEMRIQENFVGFDFTNIWYLSNSEYPYPQFIFFGV